MTIKTERFKVDHPLRYFTEVYAIVDGSNIHISMIDYNFNITLDKSRSIQQQLDDRFQYGGDVNENEAMKTVLLDIIDRLGASSTNTIFTLEQIEIKLQAAKDTLETAKTALLKSPDNVELLSVAEVLGEDVRRYEQQLRSKKRPIQ